ncbi:CBS domain protein [Myxococcus xanthus DK 1622]|uniref:CBS domain protein n=2 Tax=Myxococcaceae TaxID=31 RepID=Q1DGD4_MYXXD|nr:CBS domain protein [Myxococcus xanthus DK 1622]NOJ54818.1 CBS domain-containing protein [Myxococcus xanthus]QPM79727.1 CBS domain-containing protein [Myxococcus xanthus]QVW68807.1 CBS domain-containing protein [Myxococcus xanthus DZ2]UEO05080.1 CBS domain-containing protein [Myxococcus xanthus DZ2]
MMRKVQDVMTKDVTVINAKDSLKDAALKMRELSVGPLPVCDGDRLMGIITDRDIVVRAVSQGKDPNSTTVAEAMTGQLEYAFDDEDISVVAEKMKEKKVRRILALDRDKKLVGIVAMGDLLEALAEEDVGETLESISEAPPPAAH